MAILFENVRFLNDKDNFDTLIENFVNQYGAELNLNEETLLEGAKPDFLLKNFIKEGKDYQGLKKDLKEVIKANDLDDSDLRSKGKGFLHVCKRILQVLYDIEAVLMVPSAAVSAVSGIAVANNANKIAAMFGTAVQVSMGGVIIKVILSFVISFIINRLIRLAIDAIEFNTIKKDAEDIVDDLKDKAAKCNDDKLAKKYLSEAERLEKSIEAHSKKVDKEDKKD